MRGVAGQYPLDPPTCFALGIALAKWVGTEHLDPAVVIGMDTRESGPWIAEHVAGGLALGGVRPRFAGLITTPGLAHEARTGPFAAGVMISASHNPYQDNGLKIINHAGFKLADEQELKLERFMAEWAASGAAPQPQRVEVDEDLDRAYLEHLIATCPDGLDGVRIVLDSANGAASHLAPLLFERLGAKADCIHCSPNGRNINLHCGSQHLESLRARVLETGADLGVAFDGDADRAMFVSHSGKVVDGDAVLVRTPVGDKYVLEEMLKRDAPLGGEQSGHLIYRRYATTGDGMLTALRVLDAIQSSGKDLDTLTQAIEIYPQILVNVRVKERRPLQELVKVNEEIRRVEAEFGAAGRVLVRFSGTEPLARVMVEGPTQERVETTAKAIAAAIQEELG
jgi:phosphoglucosamine mutase